ALLRSGSVEADLPAHEHQLRPLVHASGCLVEVHTVLLGVRLTRGASATLDALEAGGLLAAAPSLPQAARIPLPEVMIAHALAHGIAQHGLAPHKYPLMRMVADLVDLGAPAL